MKPFWIVLLAAVVFPTTSFAQQQLSPMPPLPQSPKVLTWDDCVAIAARQNPTLVAADYAEKASANSYYSSWNGLLPTAVFSNTWAHNNNSGGVLLGANGLYTGQVNVNWNVFSLANIATIRSAKASYAQSEANLRQASATLRSNLLNAFANVYFNQLYVDMYKRLADIQKKNADEVALRYQSGNEYKGDMMNAKAQLLVEQIDVVQAIRSLRASVKQLDQQLGVDDFEDLIATGPFAAGNPPDFPSNMAGFVEQVPAIALQEAVVAGAKASVLSAESSFFPTFSVSYTRFREGSTEFPNSSYLWSAGANLSYPLFGGGPLATFLNTRSAKDTLLNQEETLRASRESAYQTLETDWANYANAVDQAIGEDAILESYRQRNAEGEVRYSAGLLTFDNWQIIVSNWMSAEQTDINDWQNAVQAQAAWEQALGKALGE